MPTTVNQLFRYPVKSMRGEAHTSLEIATVGVVGDRVWAVRDESHAGVRGAKNIPALMTMTARFCGAVDAHGSRPVTITAPDGSVCDTVCADINDWLSDKLHHTVTLWPLLPANDALPDVSGLAEVSGFESAPTPYYDACPIHLLTQQSLATMAARSKQSDFRVDRFRPNILLDCPDSDEPFPEAQWIGRRIQIGDVELDVVGDCPRCSMVTHGFADLPKDPAIMRALVKNNNGNMGVYANVVKGGTLQVGDTLVL